MYVKRREKVFKSKRQLPEEIKVCSFIPFLLDILSSFFLLTRMNNQRFSKNKIILSTIDNKDDKIHETVVFYSQNAEICNLTLISSTKFETGEYLGKRFFNSNAY